MKNPFRKLSYITIPMATLLGMFASAVTASGATVTAGAYIGSSGSGTGQSLAGNRFRSFQPTGGDENYLGIPSLGNAVNRVAQQLNWMNPDNSLQSFDFTFQYDQANDKLVSTIFGITLEYTGWSSKLAGLGKTKTAADLNAFQISIGDRDASSKVYLTGLMLDGIALGDFTGSDTSYLDWLVTGSDMNLTDGFTLTGTLWLEGPFSGSTNPENSVVNLTAGWDVRGVPPAPPDNEAPVAVDAMVSPGAVAETDSASNISVTAWIDDRLTGNSNIKSAEFSIDGGTTWSLMQAVDGAFDSPNEKVTGTFTLEGVGITTQGVYTVCVRGYDAAGLKSTEDCALLAVYDPTAGFVTGGGWILSPPGASDAFPDATGKATFGFVSKYQKGANVPTGNTEFQFKAGDLNFKSTSYQWLVVAGARAQYKGSGTINGQGDYQFILTAIDGQVSGGGGVDKFRIKISDAGGVVYDNQLGAADGDAPSTAIGGGSIVIHK